MSYRFFQLHCDSYPCSWTADTYQLPRVFDGDWRCIMNFMFTKSLPIISEVLCNAVISALQTLGHSARRNVEVRLSVSLQVIWWAWLVLDRMFEFSWTSPTVYVTCRVKCVLRCVGIVYYFVSWGRARVGKRHLSSWKRWRFVAQSQIWFLFLHLEVYLISHHNPLIQWLKPKFPWKLKK